MVCDRKVCLQSSPGLSERQCDLKDEGKAASERGAGSLLSLDDTAERRTRVSSWGSRINTPSEMATELGRV